MRMPNKVLEFPCFGFITYKVPGVTGDSQDVIHDAQCLKAFLSWATMDNVLKSSVVFAPDSESARKTYHREVEADKEWPELPIKEGGRCAKG